MFLFHNSSEVSPSQDNLNTYINEGLDQSMLVEKRAPMRFGKRDVSPLTTLKRAGFQNDLNEFKILRTARAPMRFGKRSDRLKKAPMRFGKRAPMRFGKRDLESPSYLNEDYNYEDPMLSNLDLYALKSVY